MAIAARLGCSRIRGTWPLMYVILCKNTGFALLTLPPQPSYSRSFKAHKFLQVFRTKLCMCFPSLSFLSNVPRSRSYGYTNGYHHARAYSDVTRVTSEKEISHLHVPAVSRSTSDQYGTVFIFSLNYCAFRHPHTSYTQLTSEQMNANGHPDTFKLVAGMQSRFYCACWILGFQEDLCEYENIRNEFQLVVFRYLNWL